MKRQWSTAALPLGILLVLAALTFWLRYTTELPDSRRDGKSRHDPDLIVTSALIRKLDETGHLQYTLVAEEIRHFPDDDATELLKPKLVYLRPEKPPVSVTARHGHLSSKGERVDLREQVEVRRAADAKNSELVVETSELTVFPDQEKGFTKSKVQITQGKSWLRGVGMQVDNKLQTYLLESQVSGQIESHSVEKKP